jgi:hypothetical protein
MRFERLAEEWAQVADMCNQSLPPLTVENASPKSDESLTNEAESRIKSIYHIDYVRFF